MSKINKNGTILKIIVTIFAILLVVLALIMIREMSKTTKEGHITIVVEDILGHTIINDEVSYKVGERLIDIIDERYTIKFDSTRTFIYDINEIKTDAVETSIIIYVNGEMSNYGVADIQLHDGDIITFSAKYMRDVWPEFYD